MLNRHVVFVPGPDDTINTGGQQCCAAIVAGDLFPQTNEPRVNLVAFDFHGNPCPRQKVPVISTESATGPHVPEGPACFLPSVPEHKVTADSERLMALEARLDEPQGDGEPTPDAVEPGPATEPAPTEDSAEAQPEPVE